jgi:drug/metabolite transporter (DMT)-like permease
MNKEPKKSMNAGNWMGVGVALGGLVFVLTSEPVWIAVGVAIGAAVDWKRPKNKE